MTSQRASDPQASMFRFWYVLTNGALATGAFVIGALGPDTVFATATFGFARGGVVGAGAVAAGCFATGCFATGCFATGGFLAKAALGFTAGDLATDALAPSRRGLLAMLSSPTSGCNGRFVTVTAGGPGLPPLAFATGVGKLRRADSS